MIDLNSVEPLLTQVRQIADLRGVVSVFSDDREAAGRAAISACAAEACLSRVDHPRLAEQQCPEAPARPDSNIQSALPCTGRCKHRAMWFSHTVRAPRPRNHHGAPRLPARHARLSLHRGGYQHSNVDSLGSGQYAYPMQSLAEATTDAAVCAKALLEGVPPVIWFIRRHMRRHRAAGLSVPQFRMLVLLERYPTASLSHAAEHAGSSLPSASRMISSLVDRQMVQREGCPSDRRQIRLVLTERGRAALKAWRQAALGHLARYAASFTQSQQQTIIEGMRLLQAVFGDEAREGLGEDGSAGEGAGSTRGATVCG